MARIRVKTSEHEQRPRFVLDLTRVDNNYLSRELKEVPREYRIFHCTNGIYESDYDVDMDGPGAVYLRSFYDRWVNSMVNKPRDLVPCFGINAKHLLPGVIIRPLADVVN